jgi:hypothetical protein
VNWLERQEAQHHAAIGSISAGANLFLTARAAVGRRPVGWSFVRTLSTGGPGPHHHEASRHVARVYRASSSLK